MALRWVDNFKSWTTMPGTFNSNVSGVTISGGRFHVLAGAAWGIISLDAQGTWIVNMRISEGALADSAAGIISFYDGTTVQCSLGIRSTGKLAFFRGLTTGTQIGSDSISTLTLDANTYYDVEIKVVIHNTTGSVEVRVNGVTEITATNVNTRNGSNNWADILRVGDVAGTVSPATRYDHLFVMDSSGSVNNDFLGPRNVNTHRPSGAGAASQFTPSAGSNHQCVDESAPNDDTDYVESNTLNHLDTYAMDNLPAGVTTVNAIAIRWRAKRTDATTRGLSPVVRHSGTNYAGANQNLGTTYQEFFQNYDTNPGTSSAWTPSDVDAAEIGEKVTT